MSTSVIATLAEMEQRVLMESTSTLVSACQDTQEFTVKQTSTSVHLIHVPMEVSVSILSMDSSVNALGVITMHDA